MSDTHTYQRGSGLQRRRLAWTAGIGLIAGPLLAGWMVLPTAAATPVDKVVICHATSSVSNPYISTQIDVSSVDEEGNQFLNGHGDHIGPVFDPDDPQDDWGDIIPAFTNPDTGTPFPGLNWPEGQAIWEAGCMIPSPSPTETSPTPTETSPTPTETSPTPTETSMTPSPGETVTVTATATVTATQVIVAVAGCDHDGDRDAHTDRNIADAHRDDTHAQPWDDERRTHLRDADSHRDDSDTQPGNDQRYPEPER